MAVVRPRSRGRRQGLKDLFGAAEQQEFLIFSIDSDLSFPPQEQAKLVGLLKRAQVPHMWITVHSDKGHDAFLLEPRLFTPHIQQVLNHRLPDLTR